MGADKAGRALRHVTSINDLSNDEIEEVFRLAARYLDQLGDPARPYRIAKSTGIAKGRILACLFHEPSTRTRLSFESAMQRLGGEAISVADSASSSASKGESLADSIRVVSSYADAIVIRHPRDGAARLAAEYSAVPVINGGDGAHEHPTQTLGDLFTLKRECKKLKGLNVAIAGDLKHGRTVHSLVYALARFGANIILMPAKGMDLPDHVQRRLRGEFHGKLLNESDPVSRDALYVTRFQKERSTGKGQDYPKVDAQFLKDPRFAKTRILHPLPRVDELDPALDGDLRAAYFRQASFGVPVRMALLSLLLGLEPKKALTGFDGGFRKTPHPISDQSEEIACTNQNCIVHDPIERRYTQNKFYVLQTPGPRLRCFYCETDRN
jgi:aspartate carbamoyltransferase catalytic subunit